MPARHAPLLLALVAATLLTACSTTVVVGGEDPATPSPVEPSVGTPTAEPTPRPGLVVGRVPDAPLPLAEGLVLDACEGGSPQILCVVDPEGRTLGTVLVGSGPAGGDGDWLEEDTRAWVDAVGADRRAACPGRDVATHWQSPVPVAGREGVVVGLRVRTPDGVVTDATRSWRVADDTTVAWVTVNAATADACVPEVEQALDPAWLEAVSHGLDELVAGMEVPDAA